MTSLTLGNGMGSSSTVKELLPASSMRLTTDCRGCAPGTSMTHPSGPVSAYVVGTEVHKIPGRPGPPGAGLVNSLSARWGFGGGCDSEKARMVGLRPQVSRLGWGIDGGRTVRM